MLLLTVVAAAPLVPAAIAAADIPSPPVTENMLAMFAAAVIGTGMLTATILLFFINALSNIRRMIYERDKILRRFASRHNREDDDRFDILVIREWQTAVKVAGLLGQPAPTLQTFPHRAYLDEEDDPGRMSDLKAAGIAE
jgi:hypothetical protein